MSNEGYFRTYRIVFICTVTVLAPLSSNAKADDQVLNIQRNDSSILTNKKL